MAFPHMPVPLPLQLGQVYAVPIIALMHNDRNGRPMLVAIASRAVRCTRRFGDALGVVLTVGPP